MRNLQRQRVLLLSLVNFPDGSLGHLSAIASKICKGVVKFKLNLSARMMRPSIALSSATE